MAQAGTILVTGGSRGIGAATAALLAAAGHRVVIVDIAPRRAGQRSPRRCRGCRR